MSETEEVKQVNFAMSESLHRRLAAKVRGEGRTVKEVLTECAEAYLGDEPDRDHAPELQDLISGLTELHRRVNSPKRTSVSVRIYNIVRSALESYSDSGKT